MEVILGDVKSPRWDSASECQEHFFPIFWLNFSGIRYCAGKKGILKTKARIRRTGNSASCLSAVWRSNVEHAFSSSTFFLLNSLVSNTIGNVK